MDSTGPSQRMDSAAQPPFQCKRERRREASAAKALFSPLVTSITRLPSSGDFDPSPHVRRMCTLCGMTRTCSECYAYRSLSLPFSSRGASSSAVDLTLSPPQNRSQHTTLSEWELMAERDDGTRNRAHSKRRVGLSRATTVSSRMRDAFIDQQTFRGRYGKMLAQYSSMQSSVQELQNQLLHNAASISQSVGAELSVKGENSQVADLSISSHTIRELQGRLIDAEDQLQEAKRWREEARQVQPLKETVTNVKRDLTMMTSELRQLVSLATSTSLAENKLDLVRSEAACIWGMEAEHKSRTIRQTQKGLDHSRYVRSVLRMYIHRWWSALQRVAEHTAIVNFVSHRQLMRSLLKETFLRWSTVLHVLSAYLDIIVKMCKDQHQRRVKSLRRVILRVWHRHSVLGQRVQICNKNIARRLLFSVFKSWHELLAVHRRRRRLLVLLADSLKHKSTKLSFSCWLQSLRTARWKKRALLCFHIRGTRSMRRLYLSRLRIIWLQLRSKGEKLALALMWARRRLWTRVFSAWHSLSLLRRRVSLCLGRASVRMQKALAAVSLRSWLQHTSRRRRKPRMKQRAATLYSHRWHTQATYLLVVWRSCVRESRRTQGKLLAKSSTAAAAAMNAWRETWHQRKCMLVKAQRVLQRLAQHVTLEVLLAWSHEAKYHQSLRKKSRRLVHLLAGGCVARSLVLWADYFRHERGLRQKTANVISRILRAAESGVLRRWHEMVLAGKGLRHKSTRLIHRILSAEIARSFDRWNSLVGEMHERHEKLRQALRLVTNSTTSAIFWNWAEQARLQQHRSLAGLALTNLFKRSIARSVCCTWRREAKHSRMLLRSLESFSRHVFLHLTQAVHRQRHCFRVLGTCTVRIRRQTQMLLLGKWRRKVALYKVVAQRCGKAKGQLLAQVFHAWLRGGLYSALVHKTRHVIEAMRETQMREFASRCGFHTRRFRACFYLWIVEAAVMFEARVQHAKALRRFLLRSYRHVFSSWIICVHKARAVEESTMLALHAVTHVRRSHKMLIPFPSASASLFASLGPKVPTLSLISPEIRQHFSKCGTSK